MVWYERQTPLVAHSPRVARGVPPSSIDYEPLGPVGPIKAASKGKGKGAMKRKHGEIDEDKDKDEEEMGGSDMDDDDGPS